MFWSNLIFALFIGWLIALIASIFIHRQNWLSVYWVFFLFIFLAAWAAGLWLTPFGPTLYGIYWMPYAAGGLIFALVLAAFIPASPPHSMREAVNRANRRILLEHLVWLYVWGLIVFFILAIFIKYISV